MGSDAQQHVKQLQLVLTRMKITWTESQVGDAPKSQTGANRAIMLHYLGAQVRWMMCALWSLHSAVHEDRKNTPCPRNFSWVVCPPPQAWQSTCTAHKHCATMHQTLMNPEPETAIAMGHYILVSICQLRT